ncbi:hypothetical protein J2741_000922 [Methanolinea mesophila]|uniref:hypothetical protein n=1 Tax=Methanolinea mesophila TaxID=547055 RepID=UPI001AEA7046|nr:hypothetical protein [Methanolinea mesophila]MBP1928375.1 hypothetical protein [Methanolinea mesophila]
MKRIALILALAFAAGMLFTAGCVQSPGIPGIPTASPTSGAPGTLTTGPTQQLPADYSMEFQVQSNGNNVNPMMEVSLRGGNGFNLDTRIDVTQTEPDGSVQTATMLPPFYQGQTVTFPCSADKNRIEIWVTAPTGQYKVYDQVIPFKTLNPY